jgi:asparaginyl-tRNA synthetase
MTYIKDLKNEEGKTVSLNGWVSNKRTGKGLVFIILRDGTGLCQCVVTEESIDPTLFQIADKLSQESSLKITGTVHKDERQIGGYEIQVTDISVYHIAEEYPISNKPHGIEFLMDNRHLWLRSRRQWAIMKIRNTISFAIHKFFQENDFVQMDAPIFTGNACEGTSNLFETEFYDTPAYLSQSGQLYGEAMAMAMGKIYTFGPTFRAEKSKTRRHLSEFWMIEPEMAFCDIEDNQNLAEEFIQYLIKYAMENCADDLAFLDQRLAEEEKQKPTNERQEFGLIEKLKFVTDSKFERITYTEAIAILLDSPAYKKKKFKYDVSWGIDMQSEHERYLVEKHFKKPVIVTGYPAAIKAFYMRLNDGCEPGKQTVAAMDILAPGIGEIVGGSQREERLDKLVARMEEMHIPTHEMSWYLDTRRFGTVPHAGFGLGFERMVQFVTGMGNIRDVIAFARTPKNCEF